MKWRKFLKIYKKIYNETLTKVEVLHLFRCSTHTPRCRGAEGPDYEMIMNRRENEDEMKMTMRWTLPNQDAKRGNADAEGKRKHQHMKTWPTTGEPWKGKEKENRRQTETEQDQRRRGKTEAPEPTWHGENLQQPQHATGQTYLEGGERKNTWKRTKKGTHGDLVKEMMHPQRMQSSW